VRLGPPQVGREVDDAVQVAADIGHAAVPGSRQRNRRDRRYGEHLADVGQAGEPSLLAGGHREARRLDVGRRAGSEALGELLLEAAQVDLGGAGLRDACRLRSWMPYRGAVILRSSTSRLTGLVM